MVRWGVPAVSAALACLAACGAAGTAAGGTGGSSGAATGSTTTTTADVTSSSTTGGSTGSSSTGGTTGGSTGPPPPPVVPGLLAEYYATYHDLVLSEVVPTLDAQWGDGAPAPEVGVDRFSARWSGWLTAPATGTYTLVTESDDGVRVWIDDAPVIDDWNPHYVTRNEAPVDLVADQPVTIRIEYFEIDLEASMRLAWSGPGLTEEDIPTQSLSTVDVPTDLGSPKPPYHNPVVPHDCPDPGVIGVPAGAPDTWYMVCTGGSFPIRSSRDLVFWDDTGVAILPNGKPSWAANGNRNWAPEIHRVGGGYVAYFTTVDASNTLCIGAATADDVLGPYTESAGPLVQNPVGVIDATEFEDGGVPYLLYKIDGNSVGQPTPIYVRELAADGLSFAPGSSAVQVLVNDSSTWEGGVIEAPWVVTHDGSYYIFYSGNVYDYRYRTGVARASSLLGPYEKHGAPILANNETWVGPGHGSVLAVSDGDVFVYHAWSNAGNGTNATASGRQDLVDRIDWVGGWPQIGDGTPSRSWQPWPTP